MKFFLFFYTKKSVSVHPKHVGSPEKTTCGMTSQWSWSGLHASVPSSAAKRRDVPAPHSSRLITRTRQSLATSRLRPLTRPCPCHTWSRFIQVAVSAAEDSFSYSCITWALPQDNRIWSRTRIDSQSVIFIPTGCTEYGIDFYGGDLGHYQVNSFRECLLDCK